MMSIFRVCFLNCIIAAVITNSAVVSAQQRYAPVVDHILEAWNTADVVCLGEAHDRFYDNELRIALIQHPAFPRLVRVIVLEMANPIHQELLDRFIVDGAPMSRSEIAPIWRDATNPEVWESPLYEQLLRAIRDVNLRLPREQRVRVIGGDSKVDWSKIKQPEDLLPLMNRGGNIREIIATQVLEPHLKALAIYGSGHCIKVGRGFPGDLAGRYPKQRFWSISPVISLERFTKQREPGKEPAYIALGGSQWAATPFELSGRNFTWGQLYDAIVYHGDVPDKIVGPDMDAFKAAMGAELQRRAKLEADASKLRGY